jgi:CheY-like chemotaxis protein
VGIPEDKLPLLFRKFSQVDSSAARRHEGAGLGLAITKSLVELMGGTVSVTSRAKEGSTFVVTLPLELSAGIEEETAAPSRVASRIPSVFAGRQALLVEDNPINQKVGVRLLEKLGFGVALAGDGREAIRELEEGAFDIVLMDCQMPVMDGLEAARRIRASEGAGRRIPIIAMTAHALEGDRQACLDAGMDEYLSKPVRPEELRQALEKLLLSRPAVSTALSGTE